MDVKDTIVNAAEFLWDLLTDERSVQRFQEDPQAFLESEGHDAITADELEAAMERIIDRLPPAQAAHVAPVLQAAQQLPAVQAAPQVVRQVVVQQPVQQVRQVTEQRVVHEHVTHQVTQQVHQVTNNNTTQQTFVREGDTVVDNRVVTEINTRGNVTLDQTVTTTSVVAGKGAVAVGGDVRDSAVNTGRNDGVLAGDDVDIDDAIVGDGNTQVNDSTVGAFSGRGPATNISGENVNTGSGDLTTVRAGGDAQVANGNGNDLTGAVDVDIDDVDGPTNLAIGDGNRQQGVEDNSTEVTGSGNTDNSVEDSGNSLVRDSGNQLVEDNDQVRTDVSDSGNLTATDDDVTTVDASSSLVDNSSFSDDDTTVQGFDHQSSELSLVGDDNGLDGGLDDGLDDGLAAPAFDDTPDLDDFDQV